MVIEPKHQQFTIGQHVFDIRPFSITLKSVQVRPIRYASREGYEVHIVAAVIDVESGQPTEVVRMFSVHEMQLRHDHVGMIVRSELYGMIRHELDECLFMEGKRLREPHE
jgi:hypothetical protein